MQLDEFGTDDPRLVVTGGTAKALARLDARDRSRRRLPPRPRRDHQVRVPIALVEALRSAGDGRDVRAPHRLSRSWARRAPRTDGDTRDRSSHREPGGSGRGSCSRRSARAVAPRSVDGGRGAGRVARSITARSPKSGLVLLRDLRELYLAAEECLIGWTLVSQQAKAAGDQDLISLAEDGQFRDRPRSRVDEDPDQSRRSAGLGGPLIAVHVVKSVRADQVQERLSSARITLSADRLACRTASSLLWRDRRGRRSQSRMDRRLGPADRADPDRFVALLQILSVSGTSAGTPPSERAWECSAARGRRSDSSSSCRSPVRRARRQGQSSSFPEPRCSFRPWRRPERSMSQPPCWALRHFAS
jgi:hypothetical protein